MVAVKIFKRPARLTLLVVAFVAAIIVSLIPVSTTFNFNLQTEILECATSEHPLRWPLKRADVFSELGVTNYGFNGALEIGSGANCLLERISYGPLRVRCESTDSNLVIGRLFDESNVHVSDLVERFVIRIDGIEQRARDGETLVLPVVGKMRLGTIAESAAVATSILRQGSVRQLGHALWGSRVYEAGTFELDTGDQVSVHGRPVFSGVIVVNEAPAMSVVVGARGREAIVSRYGARGYTVSASIVSRLKNDPFVQATWAAFGLLVAAIGLVRKYNSDSK